MELDALPPGTLRGLVRDCISRHLDGEYLARMERIEEGERALLRLLAERLQAT